MGFSKPGTFLETTYNSPAEVLAYLGEKTDLVDDEISDALADCFQDLRDTVEACTNTTVGMTPRSAMAERSGHSNHPQKLVSKKQKLQEQEHFSSNAVPKGLYFGRPRTARIDSTVQLSTPTTQNEDRVAAEQVSEKLFHIHPDLRGGYNRQPSTPTPSLRDEDKATIEDGHKVMSNLQPTTRDYMHETLEAVAYSSLGNAQLSNYVSLGGEDGPNAKGLAKQLLDTHPALRDEYLANSLLNIHPTLRDEYIAKTLPGIYPALKEEYLARLTASTIHNEDNPMAQELPRLSDIHLALKTVNTAQVRTPTSHGRDSVGSKVSRYSHLTSSVEGTPTRSGSSSISAYSNQALTPTPSTSCRFERPAFKLALTTLAEKPQTVTIEKRPTIVTPAMAPKLATKVERDSSNQEKSGLHPVDKDEIFGSSRSPSHSALLPMYLPHEDHRLPSPASSSIYSSEHEPQSPTPLLPQPLKKSIRREASLMIKKAGHTVISPGTNFGKNKLIFHNR
jgi:hypothetical protein